MPTDYSIGGSAGTTGISALGATPAPGDLFALVDIDDHSTPPAGSAGADKSVTYAQVIEPAGTATVYVTTTGSDSNNGLSWQTAFATVAHAISSLPTVSGQTVGTVEVGAGTFSYSSTITIADTVSVRIRGRGSGQSYDNYANITSPAHVTTLNYTGGADAIDITGPGTFSPSGGPVPSHVVLEDFALTGTTSAVYGISVTNTERLTVNRVNVDTFGTFGLMITNTYWFEFNWLVITRCGTVGASTPTGGLYVNVPTGAAAVNLGLFKACVFNENNGYGVYTLGGQALTFQNTDFSHTASSSNSGSGTGIYAGNTAAAGCLQFTGCWFESNAAYGADLSSGAGPAFFSCCEFSGDNVQVYAVKTGLTQYFAGCGFTSHSSGWSIDNRSGNCLNWAACTSSETTAFIRSFTGTGYNFSQDVVRDKAPAFGTTYSSYIGSYGAQSSLSGSITVKTALGNSLQLFLSGNVTASAFDNNNAGQVLTIVWVQDSSGSRTYAWPTNCKFAAGTAPTASTTPNYKDSVTFWCDGTTWWEQSRAIGIH